MCVVWGGVVVFVFKYRREFNSEALPPLLGAGESSSVPS